MRWKRKKNSLLRLLYRTSSTRKRTVACSEYLSLCPSKFQNHVFSMESLEKHQNSDSGLLCRETCIVKSQHWAHGIPSALKYLHQKNIRILFYKQWSWKHRDSVGNNKKGKRKKKTLMKILTLLTKNTMTFSNIPFNDFRKKKTY